MRLSPETAVAATLTTLIATLAVAAGATFASAHFSSRLGRPGFGYGFGDDEAACVAAPAVADRRHSASGRRAVDVCD